MDLLGNYTGEGTDQMKLIGARIRSLREAQDLDPGQLAYKANVHVSTIHKIEAGDRPNTSGLILAAIADALGTSVDYLLGRTNDSAPLLNPAGVTTRIARICHDMISIFQELEENAPDLLDQAVNLIATQTQLLVAATEDHERRGGGEREARPNITAKEEENQGAPT
jgi:transcriptional regulator with XRE-family HTH domain